MAALEIRALTWGDIPELIRSSSAWKSLCGNNQTIASHLHHFSDLCLCAVSSNREFEAFVSATVNQGLPNTVFIQNISYDTSIVGTGTLRQLVARLSAVAKEKGCSSARVVVPVKAHTLLSLFTLDGYTPVTPPREICVGEGLQGNIVTESGSVKDPAMWWRDYFGVAEHGIMLSRDL